MYLLSTLLKFLNNSFVYFHIVFFQERKAETIGMAGDDDESNYSEIIQTWIDAKPV